METFHPHSVVDPSANVLPPIVRTIFPPNFGSFSTVDTISYPFFFFQGTKTKATQLDCGFADVDGCETTTTRSEIDVCICKEELCNGNGKTNEASNSTLTYLQLIVSLIVAAVVSGMVVVVNRRHDHY